MADTFWVSQSKIKAWNQCHRLYYYRYVLNLQRRLTPNPLVRGRIIHEMIEYQLEGKDPWNAWAQAEKKYKKLFTQEKEEYGDIPNEIESLMAGYFDWYAKDPISYYEVNGKHAEHYFEVPLTKQITMKGTIDSLGHTRDKRFWMVEHKSHKQLPVGDIKYTDVQSVIYTWVIPQLGLPKPDGVLWNYIRMKAPTKPQLLKNGEMSRRQIDSTWGVYKDALIEAKLKPADYRDMETALADREADFYVRQMLPVNATAQKNVLEEVITVAEDMRHQAGKNKARSIDNHCSWCQFYALCHAELRGLDASTIRKKMYVEEDERYADQKNPLTPGRPPKSQGGKDRKKK